MKRLRMLGIGVAAALLASACGPGGGVTCATTGSGNLVVSITGLPGGVNAAVTVSGPGGSQNLTAGQTLSGTAAGAYTVTASKVTQANPLVRTAYSASVASSPACVQNGQNTTVNVAYAPIPSSNKLWIGNGSGGSGQFQGYGAGLLGSTSTQAASVVASAGITSTGGIAFDKDGNLWAVDGRAGEATVRRYAASALGASGTKTPDIVIGGEALNGGTPGASQIAFDASGNLWVSNIVRDQVLRFDAAQIRASGSPAASGTISGLEGPTSLAFDAAGNLWVANTGAARVVKYNASRLLTSTSTPPDLSLEVQSGPPVISTYTNPNGLAFDAGGNLWVLYNTAALVRLTPADQGGAGSIQRTPAVQIGLGATALAEGMAFDEGGGLWFAYTAGKFARLSPAQLTTSANPITPATVITGSDLGFGGAVALYPAPAGLPLFHKIP